ncbi:isopenicillin N synthase family oxygenase [Tolypothrix sp. FACHB-123]|uniref:isopenicillin N synthase family dioxygenase n=1 Tax=Tolypothrix sp. FACHB-123 TaxID=2692868 RepID=UPI001681E3EC|nr:isopenicillin N synthase family oxygenase [Tolypothrix sp. FACHB-123]MBD2359444.1 isopenicillin N synthase family oxygenase [Tolypothrix sp. FACHB-123]
MVTIPIINLNKFKQGTVGKQTVVTEVYQACHDIGFMYLQNHGISAAIIERIFQQSQALFDLPLEIKQQLAWSDKFSNTGYVGIERERLDPQKPGDLKEAFNIAKQENIEKVLPELNTVEFYDACTELANKILQAFAFALELREDFFTSRHNQKNHTLRLLHYPPLATTPKQGQVRAGEHSDYGSMTLLFQDNIGGLEVQTTAGEWIAAPSIPGTVIVNTGDLMQRWTNHVFCSTKHRVMIPSDSKIKQSRYSVAFFCHPNDDTEIACLNSCLNYHSPIDPPILAGEYLLSRLQATY